MPKSTDLIEGAPSLNENEPQHLNLLDKFNDIDLSQLERNLKLPIEQRLLEHQSALDLVAELEQAGRLIREKSQ